MDAEKKISELQALIMNYKEKQKKEIKQQKEEKEMERQIELMEKEKQMHMNAEIKKTKLQTKNQSRIIEDNRNTNKASGN